MGVSASINYFIYMLPCNNEIKTRPRVWDTRDDKEQEFGTGEEKSISLLSEGTGERAEDKAE